MAQALDQGRKEDVDAAEAAIEQSDENGETWKKAAPDRLAQRKIITAKRTHNEQSAAPVPLPLPSFSFAQPSTASAPVEAKPTASPHSSSTSAAATTSTTTTAAASESMAAPAQNAFSKFARPADSWECPDCEILNKNDVLKCLACGAKNPSSQSSEPTASESAPAAALFNFGAIASSASGSEQASTAPVPIFNFSAASTSPDAPTFSFGAAPASTSTSSAAVPTFNFGVGTASGDAFQFGSSSSALFTFGNAADTVKSDDDAKPEDAAQLGSTVTFTAPAEIHNTEELFKNAVKEGSGEENDTIRHRVMCRLFIMKGEAPRWVESGVGELHVNTRPHQGDIIGRLVLRLDKTHRLVLNAPLFVGMEIALQEEKHVKFGSKDLDGKFCAFLLRFKSKAEATLVKAEVDSVLKLLKPPAK